MKVFINNQIKKEDVENIRKFCDPEYTPRVTFALNKTIVDTERNIVIQLDISHNICEIILPEKQDLFKNNLFNQILYFISDSIKKAMLPRLANGIGYKIFFYLPEKSPASEEKWWNIENCYVMDKYTFYKAEKSETETILGTRLKSYNTRFILQIHLDDNYKIVKVPTFQLKTSVPIQGFNTENFGNNVFGTPANKSFKPNDNLVFGAPTNNQGFGTSDNPVLVTPTNNPALPTPTNAFTPTNGGFGAPTFAPTNGGFGAPTFAPTNGGFGAPSFTPTNGGFGTPANSSGNTFGNFTDFGKFTK